MFHQFASKCIHVHCPRPVGVGSWWSHLIHKFIDSKQSYTTNLRSSVQLIMQVPGCHDMAVFKPFRCMASNTFVEVEWNIHLGDTRYIISLLIDERLKAIIFGVIHHRKPINILKNNHLLPRVYYSLCIISFTCKKDDCFWGRTWFQSKGEGVIVGGVKVGVAEDEKSAGIFVSQSCSVEGDFFLGFQ